MVLGEFCRRRARSPQLFEATGAGAATFHLLVITPAFDVAHKEQHFQRPNVGAGSDHIDRNSYSRVILIAELLQHRFGILLAAVGDLLAKLVLLREFLPNDLDDIICVAVAFGKYQHFGRFKCPVRPDPIRKHGR